MTHVPSQRERWIQIAFAVVALAGLALFARNVDWPAAWRALQRLGVRAPLVLIPYGFVLSCDSLGWRNTFEHLKRLRLLELWRIRIATEAVSNSLPAGPAIGETLKAMILQRRLRMPLTEAAANVVLAKFTTAIAQALFSVFALVLAAPTLQNNSRTLLGSDGLEWIGFAVAFGFLAIVTLGLWAIARGRLLGRALQRISIVAGERWRHRLERFVPVFERADHALGLVARIPRVQTLRAISWFFTGFLCMGIDNFVILTLLGSGISLPEAVSMEALLALVRIAFFFLPSGLGAQEAGYYFALRAFGAADPETLTAAFMVAKRAKELIWIGIGYALLSSLHMHVSDAREAEPLPP